MKYNLFFYILIMAGVTYLIRMIPLTCFRKKITNKYIKSFLNFVPFSVLGAMTFPDVFYSTDNFVSAVVGVLIAVFLSYKEKGLLTVSISACVGVLLTDLLFKL